MPGAQPKAIRNPARRACCARNRCRRLRESWTRPLNRTAASESRAAHTVHTDKSRSNKIRPTRKPEPDSRVRNPGSDFRPWGLMARQPLRRLLAELSQNSSQISRNRLQLRRRSSRRACKGSSEARQAGPARVGPVRPDQNSVCTSSATTGTAGPPAPSRCIRPRCTASVRSRSPSRSGSGSSMPPRTRSRARSPPRSPSTTRTGGPTSASGSRPDSTGWPGPRAGSARAPPTGQRGRSPLTWARGASATRPARSGPRRYSARSPPLTWTRGPLGLHRAQPQPVGGGRACAGLGGLGHREPAQWHHDQDLAGHRRRPEALRLPAANRPEAAELDGLRQLRTRGQVAGRLTPGLRWPARRCGAIRRCQLTASGAPGEGGPGRDTPTAARPENREPGGLL